MQLFYFKYLTKYERQVLLKAINNWRIYCKMKNDSTKAVLIVEDDKEIRHLLKVLLQSEQLDISECSYVEEALVKCEEQQFDLVILDYHVSDEGIGWDIAKQIKKRSPLYGYPRIVAISGTVDIASTLKNDYPDLVFDLVFEKPFGAREFKEKIHKLLIS